jgi:hypothetical protein
MLCFSICGVAASKSLKASRTRVTMMRPSAIWLTNTLKSHEEMNSAVCQAITTELTISCIKGKVSTLPWDNFYNMVLYTAKLLDNAPPNLNEQQLQAHPTQHNQGGSGNGEQKNGGFGGAGQNGGYGGGHHNGQNGGSRPLIKYTTYTCPQMTMAPTMIFMTDDWKYTIIHLNLFASFSHLQVQMELVIIEIIYPTALQREPDVTAWTVK